MMSSGLALPDFVTPEALAKHLGWSERRVRDLARGLGAAGFWATVWSLRKMMSLQFWRPPAHAPQNL